METQENKQNLPETAETQDFSGYDDSAEFAKEQAEREEKSKQDFLLPPDPEAILEVRHLKKYFTLKKTLMGKPISSLKAVDDVSFKIKPGETLGIVGESGCGKTTMGRTILKLYQPTAGQIFLKEKISQTISQRKCGDSERRCRLSFRIRILRFRPEAP